MSKLDLIGWLASAILLTTLAWQIHKQWQAEDQDGISAWLFVGQMAASVGFIIYSVGVRNWVFVVSNVLIALTALTGQVLFLVKRKRNESKVRSG
jgi:uncharacterized protein with PQ loop repeat